MAGKKPSKRQKAKVSKVLGEFKGKDLKSSSGKKVTNRKQAIAIALSEAGLSKKKKPTKRKDKK
jgi:hypothetical protein